MKASDVPEEPIYAACRNARFLGLGANMSEVMAVLPGFPIKVVRAKLRKMILQKKICGCACGCRGDFILPDVKVI